MRRGLELLACLCVGHALAGTLYLALINVPDANVLMLGVSLLLAMLLAATIGMTTAAVLARWEPGVPFRRALTRAVWPGLPAALVAAIVFAGVWLVVGRGASWHAAHRGEIDAWFIATLNTTRTAWLHWTIDLLTFGARAILAPSMAVAIVAAAMAGDGRAVFSLGWLRAAFSRFQLGLVAMSVVLLMVLPWRAVAWRPSWAPHGAAEPVWVGVKLAVIYLLLNAGWGLVLFAANRAARRFT